MAPEQAFGDYTVCSLNEISPARYLLLQKHSNRTLKRHRPRTPKLRPKRAAGAEVAGTGKAAARAESGALRGYIVASMLVLLLALWMHANLTHLGLLVGSGACVSAGVWPSKAPASAHAPVRTRTSPK